MTKLLIAGAWTEGAATDEISVTSPATDEYLGSVPSATSADLEAAVAGARRGAEAMEAMPPFERARLLLLAADRIEAARDELGHLVALENGKPPHTEGLAEVDEAVEETFGPVLPITTFRDDDEALRLANDSDLGLQASVFTSSLKRAFRFVHGIRAGSIVVNDTTDFWEPHPPFGGAGGTRTGWGRIGGKYTLLDMTDLRTAVIDVHQTRD